MVKQFEVGQLVGTQLNPQVAGEQKLVQVVAAHVPHGALHGLNPQVLVQGLNPHALEHGLKPQVVAHGLKPQVLVHGLKPQVLLHGEKPQVLVHGLNPQGVVHGLKPQTPPGTTAPPTRAKTCGEVEAPATFVAVAVAVLLMAWPAIPGEAKTMKVKDVDPAPGASVPTLKTTEPPETKQAGEQFEVPAKVWPARTVSVTSTPLAVGAPSGLVTVMAYWRRSPGFALMIVPKLLPVVTSRTIFET
jgi:hypothetical protein